MMSHAARTRIVRRSLAIIATIGLTAAGVGLTALPARGVSATVATLTASDIGTTNVSAARTAWDSIQQDEFVPDATGLALDVENKPLGSTTLLPTGLLLDPTASTKKVRYQYYLGTGGVPALDVHEGVTLDDFLDAGFSWDAYFPNAYAGSPGAPSIDIQLEKQLENGQFQRTAAFIYVGRSSGAAGALSIRGFDESDDANGDVRANSRPAVVVDGVASAVTQQTPYTRADFRAAFGDYTVVSFGPNVGRSLTSDNAVVFNAIHVLGVDYAFSPLALDATSTFTARDDFSTRATVTLPQGATLDGNGHTISIEDTPSLGHGFMGAVVENAPGATEIHVTDVTIDGTDGLVKNHNGSLNLWGVRFTNAGGSITDTSILGIKRTQGGDNDGTAIRLDNNGSSTSRAVHIDQVTATGFQKGGLNARGLLAIELENSDFGYGLSSTPPNTIQLTNGASANIHDNRIGGVQSTQAGIYRTSTGILAIGAGEVDIVDNELSGSDVAVYLSGSGDSRVFRNVITGPTAPIIDPNENALQYTAAVFADTTAVAAGSNTIAQYEHRYDFDTVNPYTPIRAQLGALDLTAFRAGGGSATVEVVATSDVPGDVSVYAIVGASETVVGSVAVTDSGTVTVPLNALPLGTVRVEARFVPAMDASEYVTSTTWSFVIFAPVDVALTLTKTSSPFASSPAAARASISARGATGTLQLLANGSPIGAPVDVGANGAALLTVPDRGLTPGAWSISARFTPTGTSAASYAVGTSASRTLTVKRNATAAAVALSKTAQTFGSTPAKITATVSKGIAGTVQFTVAGAPYGAPIAVPTATGKVAMPAAAAATITGGKMKISAVFTPNDAVGFATATAASKTLVVTKVSTKTVLSVRGKKQTYDDTPVAITATTSKGIAGTVQFSASGVALGAPVTVVHGAKSTATLAPSVARLITAGSRSITATFVPANPGGYIRSTSAKAALAVAKSPVTIVLSTAGSAQSFATNAPVGVRAIVSAGVPGIVQFYYGTTAFGPEIEVDSEGEAIAPSSSVAFIPEGSHSLRAVFTPRDSTNYTSAKSSTRSLTVSAAPAAQ
jgi:hypothetical protein